MLVDARDESILAYGPKAAQRIGGINPTTAYLFRKRDTYRVDPHFCHLGRVDVAWHIQLGLPNSGNVQTAAAKSYPRQAGRARCR